MTVLLVVLLAGGAICLLGAAAAVRDPVRLAAFGLFLWILAPLCQLINRN